MTVFDCHVIINNYCYTEKKRKTRSNADHFKQVGKTSL